MSKKKPAEPKKPVSIFDIADELGIADEPDPPEFRIALDSVRAMKAKPNSIVKDDVILIEAYPDSRIPMSVSPMSREAWATNEYRDIFDNEESTLPEWDERTQQVIIMITIGAGNKLQGITFSFRERDSD